MGIKEEKPVVLDDTKNMDVHVLGHQALEQMEEDLKNGDYKSAFRLFYSCIVKILCSEGILKVCSPYYTRKGKIKEDKVRAELVGVFEYYYSGNESWRSFRPHGDSFRCGKQTASFLAAVKRFLRLLSENVDQDPWEVFCGSMGSDYFNLENYLGNAEVYGFSHNRRSREVTNAVLEPYIKKYYGHLDTLQFVELFQTMDRVYTTYGFPFSCTHAGWFFSGYDKLYREILEEGVRTLRDFWLHGPCGWLERQMHLYQDIPVAYGSLVDALLKPEYEPLLCRIFPFRFTDSTLRPCHGMDANEWELFTFKVSKVLHFAEHWNGQRNVDDKIAEDMVWVLNKVRYYMECEKI